MANPLQLQTSQTYNSANSKIRPPPITLKLNDQSSGFVRIPYSSMGTSQGTIQSLSSSFDGKMKTTSMSAKRRSSTIILNSLLSRRKSLQTTALATRRQSLWMSIAKNVSLSTDFQISPLPLPHGDNLIRKKALRLLLVFSYLISISLLAIALATFYGIFWSGYSQSETTTITATVESLISLISNSTFVNYDAEIEDAT
ncbi:unnamed protein product [Rotaria magnacalcarata]|uniref:Uncharacterized protein n=1 Tax=Rotaria magnacalcarata TaxID=392030 RepID=A0A814VLW3_9BILA|nr:unnamed protein product [Rotaria magnacalcarata]CAF1604773.1 unnamed protein product [Rotaria magnacalcarata]CAF2032871.1 unnamed protein product [Rotaria magnacalcarata]CAF2118634.1 unnamed protein product [Rotaria magnacalcarata]CAF2142697.1 unnamed protein product [Rotaria magnacalcarata]